MNLRPVLFCLAVSVVAALLSFAAADEAQAGPVTGLTPHGHAAFHGGVGIAVGPRVAPGPGRPRARGVRGYRRGFVGQVDACHGHWTVRRERVWVPGELIGYDVHGHEVYGPGFFTVQRTRVWVPGCAPVVAPRVRPAVRPHVAVGVGIGFGHGHR